MDKQIQKLKKLVHQYLHKSRAEIRLVLESRAKNQITKFGFTPSIKGLSSKMRSLSFLKKIM